MLLLRATCNVIAVDTSVPPWMSNDIDINQIMVKICFLQWRARLCPIILCFFINLKGLRITFNQIKIHLFASIQAEWPDSSLVSLFLFLYLSFKIQKGSFLLNITRRFFQYLRTTKVVNPVSGRSGQKICATQPANGGRFDRTFRPEIFFMWTFRPAIFFTYFLKFKMSKIFNQRNSQG